VPVRTLTKCTETRGNDELEAEMGVLRPLQDGAQKVVKPLVSADGTDLALFVITSEEGIIGRDRQWIVDVLLRETFIDHSNCSGIEELLMGRDDQFGIKYGGVILVVPMCDTGRSALN
jgi:hypothetical protein